jgi:hypothetical protein
VAFFSFMSAATSALIHADERTIAESLARSQLEFAKNQGYNASGTYLKIPNISNMYVDYTIWSVTGTVNGTKVNGGPTDPIIGIPWDSTNNRTATSETGLQKVALVIEHDGKVIYTFINSNPNWANGVEITLEGYIR